MEKKEKEREAMKKLKGGGVLVGKRAGPSTPVPTWRLNQDNNTPAAVSARKLCATLWEFQVQPHYLPPPNKVCYVLFYVI